MPDEELDNLKVNGAVTFFPPDGAAWFHIDNGPADRPAGRLRISYGGNPGENEVMSLIQDGSVGIGTTDPMVKLDINGDGRVNGNLEVTGDVLLTNADCAEDFDIVGAESVQPGTVMVLDSDGALQPSNQPYDKRVAGVISGAGDLRPGITLDKHNTKANRLPLALTGKVYCLADADYGQVEVGDLLTTSSTPGHAMKADDPVRSFGAVIGKAVQPLQAGRGLIPMLVALQ